MRGGRPLGLAVVSSSDRGASVLRHGRVHANGIEFGFLEAGSGPLALCLHGFPDSAYTWRHLLPELAGAGFRAVAPFMRGYAPTALAADGCYQLGALVADAVALHEALNGDERAVLIGHDWGAETAYGAAAVAPERWRRLVTIAIAPAALDERIFGDYQQLKRFFYLFLMKAPRAESVIAADDMAFLDRLWQDWSPGYDAAEDLLNAKQCLRDPSNLAAAIAYYRAEEPGLHAVEATDPYAAEHAALLRCPPADPLSPRGSRRLVDVELFRRRASPRLWLSNGHHRRGRPFSPPRTGRRGERAHPRLGRLVGGPPGGEAIVDGLVPQPHRVQDRVVHVRVRLHAGEAPGARTGGRHGCALARVIVGRPVHGELKVGPGDGERPVFGGHLVARFVLCVDVLDCQPTSLVVAGHEEQRPGVTRRKSQRYVDRLVERGSGGDRLLGVVLVGELVDAFLLDEEEEAVAVAGEDAERLRRHLIERDDGLEHNVSLAFGSLLEHLLVGKEAKQLPRTAPAQLRRGRRRTRIRAAARAR